MITGRSRDALWVILREPCPPGKLRVHTALGNAEAAHGCGRTREGLAYRSCDEASRLRGRPEQSGRSANGFSRTFVSKAPLWRRLAKVTGLGSHEVTWRMSVAEAWVVPREAVAVPTG